MAVSTVVSVESLCNRLQCVILRIGVSLRHQARCGARLLANLLHIGFDVFHYVLYIFTLSPAPLPQAGEGQGRG